ncbi:hypothetical protein D3C78_1486730 [compost metagenome]
MANWVFSFTSVAITSTSVMLSMPMLMNFSPLPMALRPRYSTNAAGRKNSRLPSAGLMPKNSLSTLPLPLM